MIRRIVLVGFQFFFLSCAFIFNFKFNFKFNCFLYSSTHFIAMCEPQGRFQAFFVGKARGGKFKLLPTPMTVFWIGTSDHPPHLGQGVGGACSANQRPPSVTKQPPGRNSRRPGEFNYRRRSLIGQIAFFFHQIFWIGGPGAPTPPPTQVGVKTKICPLLWKSKIFCHQNKKCCRLPGPLRPFPQRKRISIHKDI